MVVRRCRYSVVLSAVHVIRSCKADFKVIPRSPHVHPIVHLVVCLNVCLDIALEKLTWITFMTYDKKGVLSL